MKKFKLTNNKKEWFGKTLYQIESLVNFGNIHIGDKVDLSKKKKTLRRTATLGCTATQLYFGYQK